MKRSGSPQILASVFVVLLSAGCSSSSSSSESSGDSATTAAPPATSTSALPESSVASTPTSAEASTSSPTVVPPDSTTSSAPLPDTASNRLSASYVKSRIEGDLASQPWATSVVSVSEATLLRRPVVSIELTDQTAVTDAMSGLQTALSTSEMWGVLEFHDPTFAYFAAIGSPGTDDPVELPASPASAEAFLPWLNQAFGAGSPAPEEWVARVTSAEFAASVPSGFTNALVIGTDLPWGTGGNPTAQLIAQAVYAAEPSFATSFVIHFAEANYEYSGEIVPQIGQFGY